MPTVASQLFRYWHPVAAVISLVLAYGAPLIVAETPLLAPIALIGIGPAGYLAYLRITRRGREEILDEIARDALVAGSTVVIYVGMATGGFAAASVLMYEHGGFGALRGGEPGGATLGTAVYWYYLWHLASSVPLLEIPRTLNWELRYAFTDHVHGTLLLAYKLAVILPLLDLARLAIASWLQPRSNSRSRS